MDQVMNDYALAVLQHKQTVVFPTVEFAAMSSATLLRYQQHISRAARSIGAFAEKFQIASMVSEPMTQLHTHWRASCSWLGTDQIGTEHPSPVQNSAALEKDHE